MSEEKQPRVIAFNFASSFVKGNQYLDLIVRSFVHFGIFTLLTVLFRVYEQANLYYLVGFSIMYTLLEYVFKPMVLRNHITLIVQTFGIVYYMLYVVIFYGLILFIPYEFFIFEHASQLMTFVLCFSIIRFILSFMITIDLRKGGNSYVNNKKPEGRL